MTGDRTATGASAPDDQLRFAHIRAARSACAGRITLDRPAKLNALTHDMVRELHALLDGWAVDDGIRVVLLDGAGPRGLCAGGDLEFVRAGAAAGDGSAAAFWADEYRLDARIARYPKPVVAFMHGIVMGGGVGLSAHASHRIVGGSTRVAMPEVGIGLIPDVGATWLLSRAPGETGTYLALTGTPVTAADALLLGLADAFVADDALVPLRNALMRAGPPDDAAVRAVIEHFATPPGEAPLAAQQASIDRWFAADSVEAIVDALAADGSNFARETARSIALRSPTSLKLTLRALRAARRQTSLESCLRLEYRVMTRRLTAPDFHEGVRAAIIDKDRRPVWEPAELADVAADALDAHFDSLGADEWHP